MTATEHEVSRNGPSFDGHRRLTGRRRDRFLFRVPPERALELAADPTRFPEFNPFIHVPETTGRVEEVGNVYHQVFALGPIHLSTRWETTSVEPVDLADRSRPAPPWRTVEIGELPIIGIWRSTTRYDAVKAGTLVTHDLEYQLPEGAAGSVLDFFVMRPLLTVGVEWLGRRMRRWIESAGD